MKRFLKPLFMVAALALTVGFGNVQSAKADLVTFNTTGTFSGGSGTISMGGSQVVFGSGANTTTLMFVGSASGTVNTPTNANFGDIIATSTGTGAAVSGNFTLNFNVTSPVMGTDTASGTLSGSLATNQSNAFLFFNDTTANVQGFIFTVIQPSTGVLIVAPTTGAGGNANPGTTTIQGTVTGSAIPEPTTMLLLGTGLAGIAGVVRRRRANQAE